MMAQLDRRRFAAALGASGALAMTGCAPIVSVGSSVAQAPWAGTRRWLTGFVAAQPIPGALIAVARGQESPAYLTSGTTGFQSEQGVDAGAMWRIFSMTKPVTGMAAMLLVEDGAFTLDTAIADFLPEFADMRVLTSPGTSLESRPASGPITVRHLLTHTAGLGYTIVTRGPLLREYQRLGLLPFQDGSIPIPGFVPPRGAENRPSSLAEFSERLASLPLIAEPGAKYSYSVSLDLLGRVIEAASGVEFAAFMRQRLFDPLGMADTVWQVRPDQEARMTAGYGIDNGRPSCSIRRRDRVSHTRPPFPMVAPG